MEEIRDLSKQIDFNNLTYNYKGKIAPKNFVVFKGPLNFYKNFDDGNITLGKTEEKLKEFKSDINEIIKGSKKSEEQKNVIKILKHLTNYEKKLSNCLTIILELHLKLNTKQNMEKVSKYQIQNKCFKDYQ